MPEKKLLLRMVPVKSLKKASHNPPRREKDLKALRRSIGEIGLQYPILVTGELEIVDGHRRLAAVKSLGWEEVPVIVTATEKGRAYAEVNATNLKLRGNDQLHVYFSDPTALTAIVLAKCARAREHLGDKLLRLIYKKGHSLRLYTGALAAARYCDRRDDRFVTAAVRWMLEYGRNPVDEAMRANTPAATIVRAIEGRKSIRARFVASE